MRIDYFCFTSRGGQEKNEDFLDVGKKNNGMIFCLADGLGGHHKGEDASRCAVTTILEAGEPSEGESLALWLERAIKEANQRLCALQELEKSDMRSTIAALIISEGKASFANVGDSRIYYYHNGKLDSVTNDHSVAFKKYKTGEIGRFQIGDDMDQASLLRTLGNNERSQPEMYEEKHLAPGDAFLLCSDGLWKYVRDEETLIDLYKADSAKRWGELILLRAMERIRTGNDNLSLITVRFF